MSAIAFRAQKKAEKAAARSKLTPAEQASRLSRAEYDQKRQAQVKELGMSAIAFRALRKTEKADKAAQKAADKAQKAADKAQKAADKAQKLLQTHKTEEQRGREIAEKVRAMLATTGMEQRCRQSITTSTGPLQQKCKDFLELVRTIQGDEVCFVDIEGVNDIVPYSLTVCWQTVMQTGNIVKTKTWAFNPSPHGVNSTWKEFTVSLSRARSLSLSFSLFLCLSKSVARSFF